MGGEDYCEAIDGLDLKIMLMSFKKKKRERGNRAGDERHKTTNVKKVGFSDRDDKGEGMRTE